MKLSGREASRFIDAPDAGVAACLLYGADSVGVSLKRRRLVEALIGPTGADEMRLTVLNGADMRRDPAALSDATKATGFFPGPRAVVVEAASDANTAAIVAALEDWKSGDAVVVIAAGTLTTRSSLRKALEASKKAVAIGIYADAPRRDEIEAMLARGNLPHCEPDALADLELLAQTLGPGELEKLIEKLSLYLHGATEAITSSDIAAVAPVSGDPDVQLLVELTVDGRTDALVRAFAALNTSASATSLTIAAARHFRLLLGAALHEGGIEAALSRASPPVFGPRRKKMAAQARRLPVETLEEALHQILEADVRLRSGRPVPALPLVERLFVRLAHMARRA
ncbi:MAG: DNA polymerase III subunit delta [Pseudomonadota bacterium]